MSLQPQHDPKNEAEITYWNSAGGHRWVERQHSQDIVLGPILQATLERARLRQGERVVDIGCGTGASSIALAERVGPSGQVGPRPGNACRGRHVDPPRVGTLSTQPERRPSSPSAGADDCVVVMSHVWQCETKSRSPIVRRYEKAFLGQ
jgi:hypothetical protein